MISHWPMRIGRCQVNSLYHGARMLPQSPRTPGCALWHHEEENPASCSTRRAWSRYIYDLISSSHHSSCSHFSSPLMNIPIIIKAILPPSSAFVLGPPLSLSNIVLSTLSHSYPPALEVSSSSPRSRLRRQCFHLQSSYNALNPILLFCYSPWRLMTPYYHSI